MAWPLPVGAWPDQGLKPIICWSSLVCVIQIGGYNQANLDEAPKLTKEKAVFLIKDVFTSAAERDIYTGMALALSFLPTAAISREIIGRF